MSVHKIEGFRYECDNCDNVHLQENAENTYWESIPPGWCKFRYCENSAGGRALYNVNKLICGTCKRAHVELPLPPLAGVEGASQ